MNFHREFGFRDMCPHIEEKQYTQFNKKTVWLRGMQLQSNMPLSDCVLVSTDLTKVDGDHFIQGLKKNSEAMHL